MVCIQTGKSIQDPNRMKFQGTDFYVKSHEEMYRVFKDARTFFRAPGHCRTLPGEARKSQQSVSAIRCAEGYSLDSYFEHVTRQGFARRMETLRELSSAGKLKHGLGDYEQRLSRELAIIQQMKFSVIFSYCMGLYSIR
jgi:DNA polymerase-3 subunit alpha